MRKLLCLTFLMLCTCFWASAEPVVESHGRHFATANRKIVVHATLIADQESISEMMALHGAKIMDGFIASLIYPHVSLKHITSIHSSKTALSIQVSERSIKILYTSPDMRDRAMELFRTLFEAPYGQRIIHGRNIVEIVTAAPPKAGIKRNKSGVVDGVSRTLTVAEVQGAMKRTSPGDFTMAIVSRRIFRFNFDVFSGINPRSPSIALQGGYTSQQMVDMVKQAALHRLNFVPAIDLLSTNEPFEAHTGHRMNSVEGMRFVRSMIEQCGRQWKVTKICIGRKNDLADQRYMKFLYDIAANEGIELVVI